MSGRFELHRGDCREVLDLFYEDNHFDSIVTDPPYGLEFMGKAWDRGVPGVEFWQRAFRVLKPGGHLLAFSGTRTYHRMVCAIEDAGFEIRDQLAWVYGSGFPKSRNGEWGGTALKPAWEPIVLARKPLIGTVEENWREHGTGALNIDGCRVPTADGDVVVEFDRAPGNVSRENWRKGTCVGAGKPVERGRWPANLAHDGSDEVVAGFPVTKSGALTAAQQVKGGFAGTVNAYGTAATGGTNEYMASEGSAARFFAQFPQEGPCQDLPSTAPTAASALSLRNALAASVQSAAAIWPSLAGIVSSDWTEPSMTVTPSESRTVYEIATATMATIGSGCSREQRHEKRTPCGSLVNVVAMSELIDTTTITASLSRSDGSVGRVTFSITPTSMDRGAADSRFRYCAKASKSDRSATNHHPTVKPTELMRWLLRLVTPPGGRTLDMFVGSGSTGKAAMLEGFEFVGIDKDEDEHGQPLGYIEIARGRISAVYVKEAQTEDYFA